MNEETKPHEHSCSKRRSNTGKTRELRHHSPEVKVKVNQSDSRAAVESLHFCPKKY